MKYGSGLYDFIKLLHILAAIVGFGAVMLNVLYGKKSKENQGPGGLAIFDANFYVSHVSDYFRYAVFVFGFILLFSDGGFEFKDMWVSAAMGLYIVSLGVSHGVMMPTLKKMRANLAELVAMGPPPAGTTGGPPPQVAVVEALGKRVAMSGAFLNLMVVTILYLMVFKPGA